MSVSSSFSNASSSSDWKTVVWSSAPNASLRFAIPGRSRRLRGVLAGVEQLLLGARHEDAEDRDPRGRGVPTPAPLRGVGLRLLGGLVGLGLQHLGVVAARYEARDTAAVDGVVVAAIRVRRAGIRPRLLAPRVL